LTGSNFTNTTYTYINENDGSINLDGKVITYTGLEPIASTVNATNVILDYSTAAETITVTSANATQTTVDSTAGEITTFNNPTSSLTISGGATGANTFNLNSISSGFAGDLILNGSGYTNGDVVNLNANPASNDFTIDLVQNINVATGIALTTIDNPDNGDINWKAGQTINFASGSSLTTTNGLINLAAQGNLTGANYIGVNVNNAAIASVNGNITVTGTGGGISANGINLYTSNINASNSTITMTGIGTGNGISAFRSSITGNDNASLDGNGSSGYGVFLSSSPVQSSNGTVTIKGIGFDGIYANNSNITGYSNVSLDGNGSSGYGVFLSSSPVQSSNGTVTIKGIGRDGISASSNSNITGNDNVSLDGNGSSGYGVNLSTSLVQSSNGTVTIKGIGFDGISASSNSNITGYDNVSLDGNGRSSYGVFLSSSPVQSSNGTVTIKGIGFDGIYANNSNITGYSNVSLDGNGRSNYGVNLSSSRVQSTNGTVAIKGIGLNGISTFSSSSITGYDNVSLDGNGSFGYGVNLSTSPVQSSNGTVTIKGIGRDGISAFSSNITGYGNVSLDGNGTVGVGIDLTASNVTSSNGTVTVTGVGRNGFNGVWVRNNAAISSVNGNLSVTGTGTNNHGIYLNNNAIIQSTGTGNIFLTGTGNSTSGDGIRLQTGTNLIQSNSGNISLSGTGSGTGIGINLINGGAITSTTGNINLLANTINLADTARISTAGNVFINQDDDVPVGATTLGATVNITAGNLYLNDTIKVDYNSSVNRFDTINLTGAVDLVGSTLNLDLTGYTAPAANTFYTLINNDGTDAVTGTFTGIAEGTQLGLVGGYGIFITYKGDATSPSLANIGSGNDVQLYAVNRPPTDLNISANSINENVAANSLIGTFSSTDLEAGSTFTYSFVNGTNDNSAFTISGDQLLINASPDFEAKSSYSILVRSTDQGGLSYDKTLTININNVNEVPTDLTLSANTITENTVIGLGFKIGDITITDPDVTGNNNVLSLTGTDAASFELRNNTELYFVGASPDFETKSSYSINLKSTDGALTYSKAFTINVNDVNEVPTDLTLSANTITENTVIGSGFKIADITITDPDVTGNNNVLSVTGTDAASFELRNNTELYFIGASPDFETKSSYSINLKSTDGALTYSKAFTVNVNDVNEVPTDLALSANTITENTVIGSGFKIGDITITDPDVTGNNNVLLVTGTDAASFELRNNTELYFIGASPDFETKSSYSINLKSTDGALTYSKAFTVNVNDVNEVPTDLALSANTITENTVIGSGFKIGDITITDPDVTGNNNVLSLTGTDAASFELRNNTELYFIGASPDFETKSSYSINLKSTDGALIYSKAFTINVNDVNEVPTNLTLSANTITENTVIGSGFKIGDITITDPDVTGNNNVLSLTGTDAANFELRNNTELYFVGASPDFETKSSYSINLKSTDGALTYSKVFTINVNDVNEVPTITSGISANFAENGTGTAYTVTATDPDAGTTFTYSISGTDASLFNINSTTGAVTFKTSPNFENPTDNGANNVYDINVIASDGFLTDTKAVAITVNDINEVPTDLALSANTITENTVIGSGFKIGDITITDPDVTGNNNVLSLTGTDAVSFELRNNTELYFIGTSPDFETKPSYSINLKSTDGALTYSKAFTINVNDVNEVPTITSGISANFAENGTGTAYTVTATDPDAGTTFTYSISGTDASLFNINSTTGAVTFKTSPNFENPTDNGANNVYDINVIASDGFLTDTKAITITVNDINEVPTDLTLSANTITENTVIGLGFKIGDITITDPDVTGNNNVLSLTGTDAASFELRNNTELYFIGTSPDFETKPSYSINLKSTDGALTYSKAFIINVNDVNEVPTDLALSANTITENTVIGSGFKIADITITDPDVTGNNNVLSVTGTDAASFELRNNTELYFIGASPDFETKSGYSINLKSTDGALTYSKAFTVNVNDVNEVPTDFSFAPRNINEHTLPTQIAGLFSGRDPDIGDVLSYSFVAGTGDTDNGLFLITSNPNGNINPPPIAWYSFEGNTSDTNGTKNSTAANGVTYTGGRFGNKAAVLDGNSSYIDIPQSVLDNFSISAWIKTTDTSNNGNFWWEGKGIVDGDVNGISNDFGLALLGNKAAFGMGDPNNNTDITIRSQTTINDGNWHHLAVTRDRTSGVIFLYVDGIQEATIVGPTGDITAPPRLRIGGLQNGSNFLAATIDEVQIYDRALSAQEVIALNRANTINTNNHVLILNTASPSIDNKPVYNVRVKISDQNGLGFEKPFSILVNDLPPTVQSPKNNDVLEFRGDHDKSQIKITIDQNNSTSNLLNEICAYKVDDADGKINGLGKNDNGYIEAALGRSIVVFSTLANLPGGFKNEDVVRSLEMKYGDQIRFYLVKGNTTQDVLRMKNYTTVVMEPLQVSSINSSTFLVKFSDLSIKVESSTELPPSGTSNSLGQQGAKEGELLYVGTETKATFTINREAAYNNFVGFYKVVDQQGGIDINNDNVADFKPGDAGYAKAAIDRRVVDLTGQNQVTVTGTGNFTANSIFAPFIIVDGNAADFAKGTKQAYFTYLGANSDGVDHIRLLGNNIFGFEDLPGGGDRDFNDIIVKVTLKA
jgi:Concanavalin A-like lectin/glucanases superfamily/Domain of unknown function (DUF4114)